ncbi:hypothetical protein VTG60DRAFT_2771 [Thermothelomyces hinnuleus]
MNGARSLRDVGWLNRSVVAWLDLGGRSSWNTLFTPLIIEQEDPCFELRPRSHSSLARARGARPTNPHPSSSRLGAAILFDRGALDTRLGHARQEKNYWVREYTSTLISTLSTNILFQPRDPYSVRGPGHRIPSQGYILDELPGSKHSGAAPEV